MPDTPAQPFTRRTRGYPGRDQLDAANMRFRKAVARLAREGARDPATAVKLPPIIAEAVQTLDRLTAEAADAEGNSERHRVALAAEAEKLARLQRRLGRRGGARG
ncbi:hypothetical protein [Streptomyces sp. NPDC048445]|uniref:hypothetical protein n=1 Tax=Streptomyces sp. NPDC048445 TaxID=3365553 RepID=UPI0037150666